VKGRRVRRGGERRRRREGRELACLIWGATSVPKTRGNFLGDVKYKGVGKFCKYRHISPKRCDIGPVTTEHKHEVAGS